MALNIGAISASLTMDASPFRRGILEAQALTSTFGSTLTAGLTSPVLGAVQVLTQLAGAALTASDRLLNTAESAQRTSDLTGVSVETVQSFRNALADMGLDAKGADAALTAFNRKLGDAKKDGGATADSLARLGVNLNNVGTGEAALRRIFDQLSRIDDVGKRAAAAAEIFDRQFGAQLLSAVRGGSRGIDELNRSMKATGRTIESDGIAKLAELDAVMDQLKGTVQGVTNTLLLEFLQGAAGDSAKAGANISALGQTLRRDLAEPAREVGQALGAAANGLTQVIDGVKMLSELPGVKQLGQGIGWTLGKQADYIEGAGTFVQTGRFGPVDSLGPSRVSRDLAASKAAGRGR